MIPSENGLIGSNPHLIAAILWWAWFIAGAVLCAVLTAGMAMRNGPQLTTQTDQMTGTKKTGLVTWFLVFSSFTVAPPLVYKTVVAVIAGYDWLNTHMPLWWVLAMLLVVSGLCGYAYWKLRMPRGARPVADPPPLPWAPPSAEPAPMGWELPEGMRNGGL